MNDTKKQFENNACCNAILFCLVGPFQSDALLVPRTCLFDHIHDSRTCQSYDAWNQSAIAACAGRGLVQQSFAIMQPCAVDRFSGAEFVCCPASSSSSGGAGSAAVSDNDDEGLNQIKQ